MKNNIFSGKLKVVILGLVASIVFSGATAPFIAHADYEKVIASENQEKSPTPTTPAIKVVKTIKMVVTAYSSTPDQTDETPFDTASGKRVADGIIANNGLPFGTKVRIPKLFGDKIFTVEDRMHKRKGLYHADIWFPTYKEAKNFGAKYNVEIEVLES
jgi:3D (Asp-Asp-Asp) domain-containing protein